ncbi:aarF domain-containing kinase 1 isoform X2 [Diprion similis]|uniref:aarF domain-containing kinase 1 isoform X2 n=1 Tax=Diprion similis TaxID=362088 RepID=UPI001EF77822|nr:aarF domain-containing kinase 1 isoform X2 [Diprion similis]
MLRTRVMSMRRLVTLTATGGAVIGTLASLRANEYDVGAIGVVRLTRAALTVFQIGTHYKKKLYSGKLDKESPEYAKLKSQVHLYGAQKLLDLCCANKGVYIKVGQHIGALDYLLPTEYVNTLRILHSSAPQSSFSDVLIVIEEDFKKDAYEIFESIEPVPLGTASLAQVHKAVLRDGRLVAVKVQHRAVKSNSYIDIKTMAALVKITSWVFPDFKFDWIVDESKKNIPQELDFTLEGRNAEKVKSLFKDFHWLKVPNIFWELSSSRVLTMEFLEGGHVNDVNYLKEHNVNPYEVSGKLGRLYSRMIFVDGFVHSDPHPGNILIRNKDHEAEIVLLDHGLYATLSDQFRWEYAKLWLAILNGDRVQMRKYAETLGVGDLYGLLVCMVSGRSWDTIMAGIQKTKFTDSERDAFQEELPNVLPQISEVLERVNRQMLLVLKTNDLMRGIEHTLKTQARMSAFIEMSKCCVHSVYDEKQKLCKTSLSRWLVSLERQWSLVRLSVYYVYLGVINFDLHKSIEALWTNEFYSF